VVVSETPSPSPTPTALSDDELLAMIPQEARGEDFQSASIFARFFLTLYPEMMQTKDSRLFALLSDDTCVFCQNALASYDDLIASNGSVTGGDFTFDAGLASGGLETDGTTNASFGATTAEAVYLDDQGNVSSTVPERSGRLGVRLRYDQGHWSVLGVGSEES